MPEILIPSAHRTLLASLLSLPEETAFAVTTALKAAPTASSLGELGSRMASATNLDDEDATAIVGMLASMYQAMVRAEETPSVFVDSVIAASKELPADLLPSSIDWEKARHLLLELMSLDQALGVSSKILGVVTDHDHVYCRSRVLTDIRPVFANSVADAPSALVVVHTLRLTYHSGGDTPSFFVALDGVDLEDLRRQLDRAVEKEKSLRAMLAAKELPILSASEVR